VRYLVTGGAGFIGSNIVEELLRRGRSVRVLDNFSTGRRENLASLLDDIELVEGDIRSYHVVLKAAEGIDVILHQAALPSVPRSIADPITTNEVNVVGTLNVLEAARQTGVRRVVYASSSSIYGDKGAEPKRESMTPNPLSPYAVSKLAGEEYCGVFSDIYGLETVCLRYFNVFGRRQDPTSEYSAVIPRFIRAILRHEAPTIFGTGRQTRDFTHVDNVVTANLLASEADCDSGLILNCACGTPTSIEDLVSAICGLTGHSVVAAYARARRGEVQHSHADISLAASQIGYRPDVDFREGLRRTIESFTS
jgi:UDP-glucose 4-epimerase